MCYVKLRFDKSQRLIRCNNQRLMRYHNFPHIVLFYGESDNKCLEDVMNHVKSLKLQENWVVPISWSLI
jgi:hypothetical protein